MRRGLPETAGFGRILVFTWSFGALSFRISFGRGARGLGEGLAEAEGLCQELAHLPVDQASFGGGPSSPK